ncbi:TPA: nucleoside-diphosphate kinase [Streptococcus suis]|uniref:nucleoside-diphosphate kinase n=1 Tax=Streptococcus suis TaxID=1307 RepID=UPI0002322E6E|nr:nucleoside-diphosphate kinase [Streptococcus suis]AER44106.1 nucleoside diphosphate kinase [Streptococcus suis A7]MCQ8270906.1 nucleoside-diphosphate kinase [Streptococcus suis]MEE3746317.1 nucleoside-diphosphate kinase [Streptococcus suis]UUM48465.1 nucleoside-diphosphate kinase [Streptococcus suis]HEL1672921.1 nucleoside-diphosphate kinase [Streptococcus suis]
MERTFFIIKPDALKRGLAGQILSRIERRGFQIQDLKMVTATEELISQHYEHLTDKPFFPQLVQYMTSGPMIAGIIEGPEVIKSWRDMMGAINPVNALPETIRGDFATAPVEGIVANVVHGSDSAEAAEREIGLWLGK